MKPADYQRTIAARAFDVTRYLLPLAAKTNVGQVVSIRTLEKQMTRLLSSQLPELRAIGEDLKEACQRPPVNLWASSASDHGLERSSGTDTGTTCQGEWPIKNQSTPIWLVMRRRHYAAQGWISLVLGMLSSRSS